MRADGGYRGLKNSLNRAWNFFCSSAVEIELTTLRLRIGSITPGGLVCTSVRTGIAALGKDIDAAIVQLGDMPGVNSALLDRLMAAFSPVEGRSICVPTVGGKRGNPVLWDRRFFAAIAKVEGDTGAKHLIGEHADLVCEVEMTGEAAITDIDTPEALAAWRARSVSS